MREYSKRGISFTQSLIYMFFANHYVVRSSLPFVCIIHSAKAMLTGISFLQASPRIQCTRVRFEVPRPVLRSPRSTHRLHQRDVSPRHHPRHASQAPSVRLRQTTQQLMSSALILARRLPLALSRRLASLTGEESATQLSARSLSGDSQC